ncbi:VOC family protein [Nocardioides sp.]|uniref:VOC family protein n=1 Tax=Nocardioides sp. TaxID=35761 RepID=UPI003D0F6273
MVFWVTAFLDFAADDAERGLAFWRDVTGYAVSARRGEDDEFATLVPPDGDEFLKVQRRGEGSSRIHLDVHHHDPRAAADRAVERGAHEVFASPHGYVVLTSPGGLTFCIVSHPGQRRPTPVVWPTGHHSMVYQVCLDLPTATYEQELAFWTATLGARAEVLASRAEFSWLRPPRQFALDLLVQRLDDAHGPVRAHLDLGTPQRPAEVARHEGLGATALVTEEFWTVMADPGGLRYCITDRDPRTGRLA